MAQKVVVELVDDLDGGEASSTVTFGIDGKTFEIDLSDKNEAKLRKALEPFLAKARRGGGRAKPSSIKKTQVSASTDTIRQWATANGYEVSSRGRIAGSVIEAFEAANGS